MLVMMFGDGNVIDGADHEIIMAHHQIMKLLLMMVMVVMAKYD